MSFEISLEIVEFCAKECEHQKTGPLEVAYMVHAYMRMLNTYEDDFKSNGIEIIINLGKMVEPKKNFGYGWRRTPVIVSGQRIGHENIPHQLKQLMNAYNDWNANLTAEEFYQEFESIHPFVDGNGRVGVILYNWMKRCMDYPVNAPKYKGERYSK